MYQILYQCIKFSMNVSMIKTSFPVEVEYKGGPRPAVTGSALFDDVYMFQQFHFHWGSKNTIGSEHAVFGQKFAMEVSV